MNISAKKLHDWANRLDDAMLLLNNCLPGGIDMEADPNDESPHDTSAHVGGLAWSLVKSVRDEMDVNVVRNPEPTNIEGNGALTAIGRSAKLSTGGKAKLAFTAPDEIRIDREKVRRSKEAEADRKTMAQSLQELHDAGLSAWDSIPDPEAYIRELRGGSDGT